MSKLKKGYEKSLKRAYSSKRNLKRRVRNQERSIARRLYNPKLANPDAEFKNEFNTCLEWSITWAIKIPTAPDYMWCDNARVRSLEIKEKRVISLEALVFIGEEGRDYKEMRNCKCSGMIELKSNEKGLKKYRLRIEDAERAYIIEKKA